VFRTWKIGDRITDVRNSGVSVFPTWLVVKDHVPIETDKYAAAAADQQSDEEVGVSTSEGKKVEYTVGESTAH